ncbi:hypothetical protein PSET11_03039 [Arthrobacter ulcerisalmonis]|uniref:Phage portal protein n=1 Tax=Arthrobacter ulcerisalmonis TaxID=2483813 RepID=A0A3P5XTB1_9MICC|nr:hypothetical protein [Arthrobacter ulcerisalmonis]VDC32277.1 hypothetical protein PSET11_03039 [Arthrobacter ulcerisalmonis]
MGIFSKQSWVANAAASISLPAGILSPTAALAPVIFPDIDTSNFPVSVAEAMQVPAVARAIHLFSGISSRFTLDSDDNSTPWLAEGYGFVTPQLRIALTIHDLIFYNCSLWQVERDENGNITAAQHVSRERWGVDAQSAVKIDDKVVNPVDIIFFSGLVPGNGFLDSARSSVRQYTSISRTINNRAAVAEPVTLVSETVAGAENTKEEVQDAMDDLRDSLTANRGGMVYVPYGISIEGFGASDNANTFMSSARNAIRLDLSNHLNIKAELLEGAADGSSDTYSSTLQNKSELLELSIKSFTEPIADRLSLADVTNPGTRVRFDYSTFDTAPNDTTKGTVPNPNED